MQNENNNQMSFSDLLNTEILANFNTDISLTQISITMLLSFLIGLFIYTLYKRIFSGVLYSKNFNITLVGLSMITSLVIMAIGSNLILSLGMVGALSIVRFRTPIKDPTDLVFLFWALASGIITGAGFYSLAILGSIIVGVVLFVFMKKSKFETPYLFIVSFNGETTEQNIYEQIKKTVNRYDIKQKSVTASETEITFEVRLKEKEPGFVNSITNIQGVENAVLLSYNGDYVQ
ncbi:DUF4956 domain-containing protein [Jeotgalibacillus sp. S-D1]|uniref:DUF4956 domain-containing protein n=1 Tax=Jeotgalibacillus sp. S-D1 TaxID=2552189 RepID=UPI001059A96F|nr:DUF4956 domain-containing protein [Jeotgalibacillus sp. S-D1]TDL30673.1 DUF4956 domain-containing protein [Jeotgalibacillus sp. S-D1]